MRRDLWLFLFVLGAAFFSWPILSIVKDGLVLYLFIVWLVFIGLIRIAAIFSEKEESGS